MKALNRLACTALLATALSGCGSEAITLGDVVEATDEPTPPQVVEPEVSEVSEPAPSEPEEEPYDGRDDPLTDITEVVLDILRVHCGNCHVGLQPAGDFGYVDDIELMIDNAKIVPGSKEDSPVYVRMENGTMPPLFGDADRPTQGQIALVGQFIDDLDE